MVISWGLIIHQTDNVPITLGWWHPVVL